MRVQGTITVLGEVQTGTSKAGKEYKKREGCIIYDNSNPTYPKGFAFTIMGKNVDSIQLAHGENVDVEVDITINEYNGKYYNQVSLWKKYDAGQQIPPQYGQPQNYPQQPYQQQGNPYGMVGPQTTYTPPAPYGNQPYQQQQPQQTFGPGSFPPPPQQQQQGGGDLPF